MRINPELSGVVLVLRGKFNPPLITPDWLIRKGFVEERYAEESEVEVIHRSVSIFKIDRFEFRIERSRIQAEITEAPYINLSDMLVRVFREGLPETPIWNLGINFTVHFNVENFKARDAIGEKLAPKEAWGDWAEAIRGKDESDHGGLRSLTMEQKKPLQDGIKGYIHAKIEPSLQIGDGKTGIYMEVNDHYEVDEASCTGPDPIIPILGEQFDASIENSKYIIDQVMKLNV